MGVKNIWIKDPIHGFIELHGRSDALFLELMDSPEVQRLRRIKQLGFLDYIYPGAEHSRFAHSLGTFVTARNMINHFSQKQPFIGGTYRDEIEIPVLAAALLHDIGHGPLSHSFELVTGIKHEQIGKAMLVMDTNINAILCRYDRQLPTLIHSLYDHAFSHPLGNAIISSQLDADRLDYICRDSYMTGANYGFVDIDRIISVLVLHDNEITVLAKGLGTIEEYLLARYFMYWEVYLHKTGRGMTLLLSNLFLRLRQLIEGKALDTRSEDYLEAIGWKRLLLLNKQQPNIDQSFLDIFLSLDDSSIFSLLKILSISPDNILADFSRRILNRDLLKPIAINESLDMVSIERVLRTKGYDSQYYMPIDEASETLYKMGEMELNRASETELQDAIGTQNKSNNSGYVSNNRNLGIKIYQGSDKDPEDIANVSIMISRLLVAPYPKKRYVYLPEAIRLALNASTISQ